MIKIVDEIKKLNIGDYGDRLENYDGSDYICDAISEIADENVDTYYPDLFEWAKENYVYINDANDELGMPHDIIEQIQQGQYYAIEQEIYENLQDCIKNYAYKYIFNWDGLNTPEVPEDKFLCLESELEKMDHNNTFDDIIEVVNDILLNEDEE